MKKTFINFIIILFVVISLAQTSLAGMLYSKPEFRGRIIDAETKQPIEGTVVVVLYYKRSTAEDNPGGTSAYVTKAKETLTDNKGEFYFPSYHELMLFTEDVPTRFIFYKPGYLSAEGASLRNAGISDIGISFEKYFSSGEIGILAELEEGSFEDSSYIKWKGPLGIVELKKVSSGKATEPGGIPFSYYRANKLPLLFKAMDEDRKKRGIKGIVK